MARDLFDQRSGEPGWRVRVRPLRARHREELRRLAEWSLGQGRPCDRDIAALCLEALGDYRSETGQVLLDRPTVNRILWADVWNIAQGLGTVAPAESPVQLWNVLGWLDADDRLDPASAPLFVLREPLQCYGGLDADGQPRPAGAESEIPCQCYIPHDPSLPSGIGQFIVGHNRASGEPFLARARLRARNEPLAPGDLEPLYTLARRLRASGSPVPIHVEDFFLVGVAPADGRTPQLWLYQFDEPSRRWPEPLVLDGDGRPRVTEGDRRFRAGYRWVPIRDSTAVIRATPRWRPNGAQRTAVGGAMRSGGRPRDASRTPGTTRSAGPAPALPPRRVRGGTCTPDGRGSPARYRR